MSSATTSCIAANKPNLRAATTILNRGQSRYRVGSRPVCLNPAHALFDDFRRQVDGQKINFDLLGHCADRYRVSLTAAALRWTDRRKRAILIASRDDHMLWAKSNLAAVKSGAYFPTRKNTIELPPEALAQTTYGCQTRTICKPPVRRFGFTASHRACPSPK